MISGPHKFLLLILVLLQFIAPLVHAHLDDSKPLNGFHLHGFEILSAPYHDNFTGHNCVIHQLSDHLFDCPDTIISIGNGIKYQKINFTDNSVFYFQQCLPTAKFTLFYHEINFSPQLVVFIKNHLINSQSPRAPPFLS